MGLTRVSPCDSRRRAKTVSESMDAEHHAADLDRVGRIIQKLRPQRDSNWPTGTHEDFRRGAALRGFLSDVGRFGCSATGPGNPPRGPAFLSVVASTWQKGGAPNRTRPVEGEYDGEGTRMLPRASQSIVCLVSVFLLAAWAQVPSPARAADRDPYVAFNTRSGIFHHPDCDSALACTRNCIRIRRSESHWSPWTTMQALWGWIASWLHDQEAKIAFFTLAIQLPSSALPAEPVNLMGGIA